MEKAMNKELGRMHWSSSPDRGLDNLLHMLPEIKEKCPEVSLHIYYGFYNWESACKQRNDREGLRKISSLKEKIDSLDCVTMHGRVGQQELADEWKKAWLWLYPSIFTETFCLTAIECQLSKCVALTSDVAALQTTVGPYGIRIPGNPYSQENRRKFIDEAIKLYHDKEHWSIWSEMSHRGVVDRNFSWESTAKIWESYL